MANETSTIGQLPDNELAITGNELLEIEGTAGSRKDSLVDLIHGAPADSRYQPANDDLDSIAGLAAVGYAVRLAPGTWDTTTTTNASSLQGRAIGAGAPSDGQVLKWSAGSNAWVPGPAPGFSDLNYTPPSGNAASDP
ncbi:MAG: hypothetical protein RKO24_12930 [Candidatus Competibacter sp.]|nr:hypothetical protein [Candidatus Competibacter sp.]